VLGVELGGIHSAEAVALARYFMYTQVYFHHVRRVYDIHLKDFLRTWLPGGKFAVTVNGALSITDNEVLAAIRTAEADEHAVGHVQARRILCRDHYRVLYSRNPADIATNRDASAAVAKAATEKFGAEFIRWDQVLPKQAGVNFPVRMLDGRIESSLQVSVVLTGIPPAMVDLVFIESTLSGKGRSWLDGNLDKIIAPKGEN